MRFVASLLTLGAAGVLAACASSPSSRFYTLTGTDAPGAAPAQPASLYFELAPVDMPQQVTRNQLVVQTSPAQVKVLETERWASLPSDEMRRALSADLTRQLGAIDVSGTARPEGTPLYRVKVNVQRFESWPGSRAVIDAVWSVQTSAGAQTTLTCRTVAQERVGDGFDALVDGHRQAVSEIASAISSGVRSVAALPPAPAVSSSAKGKTAASTPNAPLLPCPAGNLAALSPDDTHARRPL
ncbi:PqiC family protein [Caballeronia sp. LP006]|uniref:PqiC family protein n=1 Tax=Caballeronia sp. LP006 TaxID=3038552 RepID=UPI002861D356|nr:PqiC family protein [Caballeronia sp. LP006]MDR5830267.1 PqiC family protein [Caballeronia sp. LP006]